MCNLCESPTQLDPDVSAVGAPLSPQLQEELIHKGRPVSAAEAKPSRQKGRAPVDCDHMKILESGLNVGHPSPIESKSKLLRICHTTNVCCY